MYPCRMSTVIEGILIVNWNKNIFLALKFWGQQLRLYLTTNLCLDFISSMDMIKCWWIPSSVSRNQQRTFPDVIHKNNGIFPNCSQISEYRLLISHFFSELLFVRVLTWILSTGEAIYGWQICEQWDQSNRTIRSFVPYDIFQLAKDRSFSCFHVSKANALIGSLNNYNKKRREGLKYEKIRFLAYTFNYKEKSYPFFT